MYIVYILIDVGRFWRLGLNIQLHVKIYDHTHFVSNHAHFYMIMAAIVSFLVKNGL